MSRELLLLEIMLGMIMTMAVGRLAFIVVSAIVSAH